MQTSDPENDEKKRNLILADVVVRLRKPRRPNGADPEANSIDLNQTAIEMKLRNRRQAEDYLVSGEDNSDENNMGSGEDNNSGEFNILHGIRRTKL